MYRLHKQTHKDWDDKTIVQYLNVTCRKLSIAVPSYKLEETVQLPEQAVMPTFGIHFPDAPHTNRRDMSFPRGKSQYC